MANININYENWQKPFTSDQIGCIAKIIEQDIKRMMEEGTELPIKGEINVKGLEDNVIIGCSTIKYHIKWTKNDPKDADRFIKSIDITID